MKNSRKHVYPIILAGGLGKRFWPLSRELEPKQFLSLQRSTSLLQQSISRILPLIKPKQVFIVSSEQYKHQIYNQIDRFKVPRGNLIVEPSGKNTAPAIAMAARHIYEKDPQGMLVILTSDHFIKNETAFISVIKKAIATAEKNYFLTIGVKPTSASTGYGYIKRGSRIRDVKADVYHVQSFYEKPELKLARKFYADKRFYFNSGMFIVKAKVLLDELKKCSPKLFSQLSKSQFGLKLSYWKKVEPISIDYAVLEKSENVAVVEAKGLGWSDLGSWKALKDFYPKDSSGNILNFDCIDIGSSNLSVFGNKRLVATIGLKDVILVDSEDAVLACDVERSEEVKELVSRIKKRRRDEYFVHKTAKRPWGSYCVLSEGKGFKVKLVCIDPGKSLSLQRHLYRSEHWVVVEGRAHIFYSGKEIVLNSNQSAYIPRKGMHRLKNSSNSALKIVEVQCGEVLEESDIQRFDDEYGRMAREG